MTRFKQIPMIPQAFRGREIEIVSDVGRLEEVVTARVKGMAGLTMLFPRYWVEGGRREDDGIGKGEGNDGF